MSRQGLVTDVGAVEILRVPGVPEEVDVRITVEQDPLERGVGRRKVAVMLVHRTLDAAGGAGAAGKQQGHARNRQRSFYDPTRPHK